MTELTCIVCPRGCKITVEDSSPQSFKASGYSCKRGEKYAFDEMTAPKRTLTSTVIVKGGIHQRLPVKSSRAMDKALIVNACRALNGIEVNAPVSCGDVVVKNILNSGADIVATRDMDIINA